MNRITRTLMLFVACFLAAQMSAQTSDRSKAHGYSFSQEELERYPQKTNVPTVYLEVYKTTVVDGKAQPIAEGETPELEDLNTVFGTKNDWYYNAQIIIRDDKGTIEERKEPTTVRGRGNSTWNIFDSKKKPLRLKFPQKTALLGDGYANEKSWVLLANHLDPTLIRNAMANEVGKKVGLEFCPAYKFVDLIVNGTYMGTYQISDQVQAAPKRVPIDESTGYLVEFSSGKVAGFLEDPYIRIGSNLYMNIKSPDPDAEYETGATVEQIKNSPDNYLTQDPKYDELKARLEIMLQLLNAGAYTANWQKYVDLTVAVNAFIGEDITGNRDGSVANNYAYMNDIDSKLCFGPLWDFDLAWGCYDSMKEKHFWEEETATFGSLCKKVYENDPYFVKALYERWQEVYNEGKLISYLQGRAQALAEGISESAALNFTARDGGGAGEPLSNWANSYQSYDAAITAMKSFIETHLKWLDSQYKAKYEALGCANLPAIPETGLVHNSTYEWGGKVYSFIPSKVSDVRVGAELTITIADGGRISNPSPSFLSSGSRTLSTGDVEAIQAVGNVLSFVVNDGTCTSVTLVPPPCEVHDYTDYVLQEDGTYKLACSVCSELKEDSETYYKFTVYPESSAMQELYATQWQPDETHPNAIATVTINPGLEANITGYNIINATKNADKNKVCPDFRLTDGHPFYSDDTFVATTATYSRSVKNDWGTIMLPFDYQPSDANAKSYQLSSLTTNDEGNQLVLTAIQDVVEAYVPVFIKRNAGVETLTITSQNASVTKSTKKSLTMSATTVEGWTLKGAIEASVIDVKSDEWAGKNVYYISNNKFWHATGKVNIKPFRAYLESTQAVSSAIGLMVDDGEATGIMSIENGELIIDSEADAWYSLDGRLLPVRPTSKGIYIHNGRKEVIR